MVTLRSRAPEELNIPGEQQQQITMENEHVNADEISEYEQSREERIRENRERLKKLGIVDLSLKLKEFRPTPKRAYHRKTPPQGQSPLPPSGPVRRSSRLQNSIPVTYCEFPPLARKDKSLNDVRLLREEGSKPEFYTEEHENLLGSTERSWTLFVDGCGTDGKRIYDPVKGKTCHQCRQKTLGHRTHCSKCEMVQGQFCGDCLYMRYGENVLEANENPDWICPVCRGICNCSLCRQAKGWAPTGTLYRKISRLGYKSVAHYLIQTRRANLDSDKNIGTKVPISAKRSLPFSDIEITTTGEDDRSKLNSENLNISPPSEFDKEFGDSKTAPESGELLLLEVEYPVKPKSEKDEAGYEKDKEPNFLVNGELHDSAIDLKPLDKIPDNIDFVVTEKSPPKSSKKRVILEPSPDCIASRLRQRRNKINTNEEVVLVNSKCNTANAADTSIGDVDSICRRLRARTRA